MSNKEFQSGKIQKVAGPLVVAKEMSGAKMQELVQIGSYRLVGEIIKLEKDLAQIQCQEDTSGLTIDDEVRRSGSPLSLTLGPGILDNIFDGIQRPLQAISAKSNSVFIPRGIEVNSLDLTKQWEYTPVVKPGTLVQPGDIVGYALENRCIRKHAIMVPPKAKPGKLTENAMKGMQNVVEDIFSVEGTGKTQIFSMSHKWPVRESRPVQESMAAKTPLLTGQRVMDGIFPSVLGGTNAVPGAFGCGKTVISQSLSKYSNSDIIVYVGCGERGNEMAEVLNDFPELETIIDGQKYNAMERTVLVANTSNMPVAAREASIYTGITLSEQYRDMGFNVSMMADSTSRWAEALREISGRLAEMPADSGYPAYLGAKLAQFQERAGLVKCLGSPHREGSVTIVGAVSPPGGDFNDPVTSKTLSIVQVFWGLDKKLAQRKHFPSVNWLKSFSNYEKVLKAFYEEKEPMYAQSRQLIREILQEESQLQEFVQLVGKDSLSEEQKVILDFAKIIKEDFLQQNAFTEQDKFCPLVKTIGMMRTIAESQSGIKKLLHKTATTENPLTMSEITTQMQPEMARLSRMKECDPMQAEETIRVFFDNLSSDIQTKLIELEEKY